MKKQTLRNFLLLVPFIVVCILLCRCGIPDPPTIHNLPYNRDIILNITTVNDKFGWYVVDPANWKMSKWDMPRNIQHPTTMGTRWSKVSWSPKTKRLVYGNNSFSINGTLEKLPFTESSYPLLSPDGQSVVYAVRDYGLMTENLYLLDIAKRHSRQITQLPPGDLDPAWSPNSQTIAFWHWHSKTKLKTLYSINKDGRNLQVLLAPTPNKLIRMDVGDINSHPYDQLKWSPDGRYLALRSMNANNYQLDTIWLLDLTTRQLRTLFPARLWESGAEVDDFDWSPTGSHIILDARFDGGCSSKSLFPLNGQTCTHFLYLVNVSNGKITKVTNIPQGSATRLVWLNY